MSQTVETPAAPTNTVVALPTADKEVSDARAPPQAPAPTRTKYTLWHPGCLTEEQAKGKPPPAAAPAPVNIFPPAQPRPYPQLSFDLAPSERRAVLEHERAEDRKHGPLVRAVDNTYEHWPGKHDRRWPVQQGVPCPARVRLLHRAGDDGNDEDLEVEDVTDDRWMSVVLGCGIVILSIAVLLAVVLAWTRPADSPPRLLHE